jgi:two-component system sensor histidine kinase KdpD
MSSFRSERAAVTGTMPGGQDPHVPSSRSAEVAFDSVAGALRRWRDRQVTDRSRLRRIEIKIGKRVRRLSGQGLAALQIGVACFCLAVATFSAFQLQVSLTTISFADLILVFCGAYYCGFWQASVISVLAVGSLDYFFTQPLFHFRMSDPRDWVSLAMFEVSALVIARLSAKELRSAREAATNRTALEQLHELNRSSLLLDFHQPPGAQLVILIQRIFHVEAVAMFDIVRGHEHTAGDWGANEPFVARQTYLEGISFDDAHTQITARVLKVNSRSVGALTVLGQITPLVMNALASLAEMAIERCLSLENEERAEKVSQSEELRTAVLDSLAHEFKTPLASIEAAASDLLEFGKLSRSKAELASLINQQASRLNSLCSKLLVTARLETSAIPISHSELDVRAFLAELLANEPNRRYQHRVNVRIEDPGFTIHADQALLAMVLNQYIDNAAKYSTPESPIDIAVRKGMDEVVFLVHNYGPVISLDDRERVFDRFYRSSKHAGHIPGTGVGLSVARKAATAQRAHVWVVSSEGQGTTFFLSIPMTRESL